MNNRIPRNERDHVLVDVKAKPSGWPMASLDPDSGRGPRAASGTPAHEIRQNQVSTVSGDCRGILMERYSMNQDRAFDFLVRASSTSNHKLRDIAQELVDQHNAP